MHPQIYDISPPLSPTTPVWPGDTPFSRQVLTKLEDGESVHLSSLTTTVHVGAHADAPNHYATGGASIDQVSLTPYLGPCLVITVEGCREILPEHCQAVTKEPGIKRVLFRTLSFRHEGPFHEDFCYFSEQAVRFLGQQGITLVGIDTPSVDAFSSKDLPSHHALQEFSMVNLEGLVLDQVADGTYELIALPLKLVGFDASPVRAVLRSLS